MASTLDRIKRAAQVSAELISLGPFDAPRAALKTLLARGFWDIEASRFLMLGLHDVHMRRWSDSMNYWRELEPGLRTINWQGDARRLTVDKLITAERLAARGLPFIAPIAVIGRDSVRHPHHDRFPHINTVEELARVLASAPPQLFAKPADGWRGTGVFGPERCGENWQLESEVLSDAQLAQRLLAAAGSSGLLLQRRLRSHRGLAPMGGDLGLSTVRINTALVREGAEILFVFAKIMGAKGLVDNFSGGRFGNLLACVDKHTGTITKVFGRRREHQYLMHPVTHHPVTGTRLIGFTLPLWDQAVDLAKQVALAFSESPLIGLDVAITDNGPLIVEAQSDWDANGAQLMTGSGLRPLLREIVPRLALHEDVKDKAMQQMGLFDARRRKRLPRPPSVSRHEYSSSA
ncbi:MAG TPA: sugar-transfer associated ATP-grasp domain-containing protein [Steroidobacteraceae bacterium]|nr:sugar-transfer associated ATP-grasp domain-containing protein [Steroidobacteraceae bacterium]